jgi:hypothetical protein
VLDRPFLLAGSSGAHLVHFCGKDGQRDRMILDYTLLMKFVPLLLAAVLPAFAQSVLSDAAKLSPPELPQFMEIVCPGQVKDAQTCGICPAEAGFPNDKQGWQVAAITMGHFTAPGQKEALMSTVRCESHAAGLRIERHAPRSRRRVLVFARFERARPSDALA